MRYNNPLHQYAQILLTEAGETSKAEGNHLAYYSAFAQANAQQEPCAWDKLEEELPNLLLMTERAAKLGDSATLVSLEEAPLVSDLQYVLVLDENNNQLGRLLWDRRNDQTWTHHQADLLDYADEPFKLHFGVYNDAEDGATGMYVDDVSLTVCWP